MAAMKRPPKTAGDMEKAMSNMSVSLGMGTTTSSRSFQLESWAYVQHKDHQVRFMKKVVKVPSNRPNIVTTEGQRLSYFRGYATAPFKLQRTYLQQNEFREFFWLYIMNVILRSIPMNYLHSFLAAYTPDEHFFSSKIVPLCIGVTWQIVICSMLQLVASADFLSLLLDYTYKGFWRNLPYVYCNENATYTMPRQRMSYKCLSCEQFKILSESINFTFEAFYDPEKRRIAFSGNFYLYKKIGYNTTKIERLQAAPQSYLIQRLNDMDIIHNGTYYWLTYFAIIWIVAALFYKQLFRNYVWKSMTILQLCLNAMYLASLLYGIWFFLETGGQQLERLTVKRVLDICLKLDFDFLAESFSGPPIIQLLSARSGTRVHPSRDSVLISASNSFFYLYRSLCNFTLKSVVESVMNIPLWFSPTNPYPLLNYWPWLFFHLSFGPFAARIFYLASLFVEFMIFMITFQILIEILVCEWRWTRRWVASIILTVTGFLLSSFLTMEIKFLLYIVTTALTALTEVIVICWMYPLERLTDDIHFNDGQPAGSIRVWSLRFLPIYHLYKLFYLYHGLSQMQTLYKDHRVVRSTLLGDYSSAYWVWIVGVLPVMLGVFYSVIKYVIGQKQSWRVLLRPRPDWGPREHITRQLRKQFDSREYVASQASRYLSRHLMAKSQTPTYRLDIKYTDDQRSSVVIEEGTQLKGRSRILTY